MQTITISLVKSLILEAVKNETFFKGQVDKSIEKNAVALAYHEQAGDETYQERLLSRALYSNLSELTTQLTDYIINSGNSTADNAISTSEEGDVITLLMNVGDRFNRAYTDPLAKLCSKYIEESILVDWWKPVNEKQSAIYLQFVEKDLAGIRRCFNKTAPVVPTVPYTNVIDIEYNAVDIGIGEKHTITYSLTSGAIDDIEAHVRDHDICKVVRTQHGLAVIGKNFGHTVIRLFSIHNEQVTRTLDVYVADQS